MTWSETDQYNIDLATRQIEINEWSYNNKMDTLFVFQILFISLLFVSILMIFKSYGIVGGPFVWYSLMVVLIIVVMTIINRSMYTVNRRDYTFWNKRKFDDDNNKKSPLGTGGNTAYINKLRGCQCDQ
jgi:hypothetical protein